MVDTQKIEACVERELAGTEMFPVEITVSAANDIEVVVDSDSSVAIEACVALSRAIEAELDRDKEDFQLTVTSAGIGQPLKLERQYRKMVGKMVDVVLKNGTRMTARLCEAEADAITLVRTEMQLADGAKRKKAVEVATRYLLTDIKTTKEYLDFK